MHGVEKKALLHAFTEKGTFFDRQAPVCRVYHSLRFWYLKEKSETYWSGLNL